MNYVLKTKDPLNEWNVILIYYVMDFLKSQKYNDFKSPCKHLKFIIKIIFWDFFVCLISSWFEIGNGRKKNYFQYHLNIHILSQFSTTQKKDFEKGFKYAKIVTTLVCFRQPGCINLIVMFWFTIVVCYKNHQHQCFHGEHWCFQGEFMLVALMISWWMLMIS